MKFFGSSGIREIFSKDLVDLVFRVGLAVGSEYRDVVVAMDTRTSGDVMKHAVTAGLLTSGARCCDAGIAPTPTLAYASRDFSAGLMVTASHNPPEYNGIKLFNPDGSSFDTEQQAQVEEAILSESFEAAHWEAINRCGVYEGAIERHIKRILSCFPAELNVRVVVDAGCGAASGATPLLLERLGCDVTTLNCYPSGLFPHPAEPIDANLEDLKRAVTECGADLGIAHDGDADRMMAIDDQGTFITGDRLLAIFARAVGAKDVVTTLDASMAIEEMGFGVRRTRIGDTWVSEELRNGGEFGGETSGAWIFPDISLCPDGIFAAARLTAIASKQKLSELVDSVRYYPLLRGSVSSEGIVISDLELKLKAMEPLSISYIDGIKLDFQDGWLLVRPSGTEPKIRLTAEARSEARAHQLYEGGLRAIKELKGKLFESCYFGRW